MRRTSSLPVFSIVFGVTYFLCFLYDIAIFRYYPQMNEFHFSEQPAVLGPPIIWYGWIVTAAIVSSLIALLVPVSIAAKIPPRTCWIVTCVVLAVVFIYERRWFV